VYGCCRSGSRTNVPRPEPEGANNLADQQPRRQTPKAYDKYQLNDDETVALLDDMDVAVADVGLQPSLTQLAPESLLQAKEETPIQPLIDVGRDDDDVASAPMERMISDSALSPSDTSITSRTLLTVTEYSYADTERNYPLTNMAVQKLQEQNQLLKQQAETSADDSRRSVVDSGRRFPSVRSISPSSAITMQPSSPGRSSTSTFLFDSESSESDVGVVRPLTLRSIAKMKRKSPKKPSPNVLVTEPEPEPEHVTPAMTVTTPSRSRTPQTQSNIDRIKTALNSPVVSDAASVPITLSPSPRSDHGVQPDSQTASFSRAATPAGQVLPASPVVPVSTQPTPVATEPTSPGTRLSPVSQAQSDAASQPVQVQVDTMKDVQKVERTDAEGRKTTVYKLTPKAGSMFPAAVWPPFAAPSNLDSTSLDQRASGDQSLPAPTASIRDAPAKVSLASAENKRSTGSDQQTIDRLKTLAEQRGEKMLPTVLKEIQGVSARAQVRSAGKAQVASLQQPVEANADVPAPSQDQPQVSTQGRLSYAPFKPEGTQTADAKQFDVSVASSSVSQAFDLQLSDDEDSGPAEKLLYTNSLSNFSYLSGERSRTDLSQRMNVNIPVSDATDAANIAASRFLRDRFDRQKKCFRGLQDSFLPTYLYGIAYEHLQPETQSLLSRSSKMIVVKPKSTQQSELQRIRSSFSSHAADQNLSQAWPDYPQKPSSSKLEQVGHRLSFLPSDAAQPDESLHPSVSRIAPKSTPRTELDTSTPDEYLHPSLHKMTSMTSTSIPARPDDAQHPSRTTLSHFAKYDEPQHPSMTSTSIPARPETSIPARPDDAQHPSRTTLSHFAKYDEPQHPSLSRLHTNSISQTSPVPAKSDSYLHPSLTRAQLKPTVSGRLDTDIEKTTTTTTVIDREYFQYDVPAIPDDILHPSSTRIVSSDSTRSEFTKRIPSTRDTSGTHLQSTEPAKPDDISQPSSTRLPMREHAKVTRQDDVTHPSSASLQRSQLTDAETVTSTMSRDRKETLPIVPARTDDILHPSSTQFPAQGSAQTRATIDAATSASAVGRKETLSSVSVRPQEITRDSARVTASSAAFGRDKTSTHVPARPDDVIQPSSGHESVSGQRDSTRAPTSATGLDRKEMERQSSAQYQQRDAAQSTLDTSVLRHESMSGQRDSTRAPTSTTGLDRKESERQSSAQYQQRDAAQTTLGSSVSRHESVSGQRDSTRAPTSATGLDRKETERQSSAQYQQRDAAQATLDTSVSRHESVSGQRDSTRAPTSATGLDRKETERQSSAQYQQRDAAQTTLGTSVSTTPLGRKETFQPESARPDRSSSHFLPRESAGAAVDSATLTTATDRKESLPKSARSVDIIHPPSTQFPSRDKVAGGFDTTTSSTAVDRRETWTSVTTDQGDITYPSFSHEDARARSTFDTAVSTTALPDASEVFDDRMRPFSAQLSHRDSSRGSVDAETSQAAVDWKTFSPESVRPDDTLRPSRVSARDSGQARASFDTATSTTALGRNEVLPTVTAKPDDIQHPSSTKFPPRETARTTMDASASSTAVGRKETLSSVPARPDDIKHPSSTQFPQQDSTRGTLDSATSFVGLGRKDSLPSVSARPGGIMHPPSSQFRQQDIFRGTLNSATSSVGLGRNQTLPSVTARPENIIHPSSMQFPQQDISRGTLDSATSSVGLDRKQTHLSVSTGPDDMTQFRPSEGTRGTMDSATSTTAIGSHESVLPLVPARPDDRTHPSFTQFLQRGSARGTVDTATSAVGLGRKETFSSIAARPDDTIRPYSTQLQPSRGTRVDSATLTRPTALGTKETYLPLVPARPDDISHPSFTQFRQRDSSPATVDAATSTTAFDSKAMSVAAKPDDRLRPSSTDLPAYESTRRSFNRYDDWKTSQYEEWNDDAAATDARDAVRGSMQRRSDLQLPEDKHRSSHEASRPSELMRPWFTRVGDDTAITDSAERPSSMRIQESRPSELMRPSFTRVGDDTALIDNAERPSSMRITESHPSEFMRPSFTRVGDDTAITDSAERPSSMRIQGSRPSELMRPSFTRVGDDAAIEDNAERPSSMRIQESRPSEFMQRSFTRVGDDTAIIDNAEHPSFMRIQESHPSEFMRPSFTRVGDDAATTDSAERPSSMRIQESRPSELMRPSFTRVGDDTALIDNAALPSSMRIQESHPSEFMRPSFTRVGDDAAIIDSAERPSSMRIPDETDHEDAFLTRSRSIVDTVPEDDVRETRREDDRRLCDRRSDDQHSTCQVRRSSMQRQTVPSSRQRRSVTFAPVSGAKSDVDARLADADLSGSRRSLPNVLDSGGPTSGTSSQASVSTDGRESTTSDVTLANYINARDSRTVTRERMKKKHPDDTATDERQRELDSATSQDETRPRASGSTASRYRSSSDRASAVRISREAAASDGASLCQLYPFDSSYADDESVTDLHQFAETEDWLLDCQGASVSRAPCGGLSTADRRRESLTTVADDRATCTTSYAPCRPTCSPSSSRSSGCDVTGSTTYRDVTAFSRTQPATASIPSTYTPSYATRTSRAAAFHDHVPCRQHVPRMSADRYCTNYHSRPADVTGVRTTTNYGRYDCSENLGKSPFARGFVQSRGSTYQQPCSHCQPSPQPHTQQVHV